MKIRGKKFLALFLVFCLGVLSGNLTAQVQKGINLTVEKNDGQEVSGELITVKRDSVLILDSETQTDLSLPIKDIKIITVHNKSRMLELGILGALLGAAIQGLGGTETSKSTAHWEENPVSQSKTSMLTYGAIGGATGALAGTFIGMNKKIQIQGKSDTEIQKALEKLSKKARVKGVQ